MKRLLCSILMYCTAIVILADDIELREKSTTLEDSIIKYIQNIEMHKFSDTAISMNNSRKLYELAQKYNLDYEKFYALHAQGDIFNAKGESDVALKTYYQALEIKSKDIDELEIAMIYDDLASIYQTKGLFEQMYIAYENSIRIKSDLGLEKEVYKTNRRLALFYRKTSNYIKALELCLDGLEYFEATKDTLEKAHTYNSIALIYKSLNNYNKALHYHNLSKSNFELANYERGISISLNNIGVIYLRLEQYQDALQNFQQSLEIETNFNNKFPILTRYNNIAMCYMNLGNFQPALEYLNICEAEYSAAGRIMNLANTYDSKATCFDKMGLTDSAKVYFIKSIELANNLDLLDLKRNGAFKLSTIFENDNNLNEAYRYLKIYKETDDEIRTTNVSWKVSNQEFEYILNKDKKLKDSQKKVKYLFIVVIVCAILLLILIFWITIKKLKQKIAAQQAIHVKLKSEQKELTKEVKHQKRELVGKMLQIVDRQSEMNSVVKNLQKLKSEFKTSDKAKIQTLINDLEHNSKSNNLWEEFDIRFSQVNENFYQKLSDEFPSLTANDKRLAALIFLNFSTKEIAQITKQTPQSIMVARSRLRKKLHINRDQEISSYLSKFN